MTRQLNTNPENEVQFYGFFHIVPSCPKALLLTDEWQKSAPKTSYPMQFSFQLKAEKLRLLSWFGLRVRVLPQVGVILLESALRIIISCLSCESGYLLPSPQQGWHGASVDAKHSSL